MRYDPIAFLMAWLSLYSISYIYMIVQDLLLKIQVQQIFKVKKNLMFSQFFQPATMATNAHSNKRWLN